jgi:hypothetical protein
MITIKPLNYGVYFVSSDTIWKHYKYMEIYCKDGNESNPESWETHSSTTFKQIINEFLEKVECDVIYLAEAYATTGFFLLNKQPIELKDNKDVFGSGFNYGSCNLITVDRPGFILILAQND